MAAPSRCPGGPATPAGRSALSDGLHWDPSDDELDELARSLPPTRPAPARLERNREALLAASQTVSRQPARSRAKTIAAVAVPLAAAAAVALWLARDTDSRSAAPDTEVATQRDTPATDVGATVVVTPRAGAKLEDSGSFPDRVVTLRDGEVLIEVSNLATDQRFRARTSDAEIETFHARFSAAASDNELAAIVVYEGRIQLRRGDGTAVTLEAGDRWRADTETAEITTPQPAPSSQAAAEVAKTGTPATNVAKPAPARAANNTTSPASVAKPAPPASVAKPAPPAAPGEREFRAGWAQTRANKHAAAAKSFDTACQKATGNAIAEDACFWAGVAAKRAGKSGTARRHLSRFLRRYAGSSRAGEASALLGWILYDAKQLDGAEKQFRAAAGDRVPKVRRSAQKGLEAISAQRKSQK